MRRKDKEIKDKALIENIIKNATVLRLGLFDGTYPYVVPINYGYKEGAFYLHSAREGKKIEILQKNNRVCVEIDLLEEIVAASRACKWTTVYRSIIGFGYAECVVDPAEKRHGLNIIMEHYSGNSDYDYPDELMEKVEIIRVKIDHMTGKMSSR